VWHPNWHFVGWCDADKLAGLHVFRHDKLYRHFGTVDRNNRRRNLVSLFSSSGGTARAGTVAAAL